MVGGTTAAGDHQSVFGSFAFTNVALKNVGINKADYIGPIYPGLLIALLLFKLFS